MEDYTYDELVIKLEEMGVDLTGKENYSQLLTLLNDELVFYDDLDELDF